MIAITKNKKKKKKERKGNEKKKKKKFLIKIVSFFISFSPPSPFSCLFFPDFSVFCISTRSSSHFLTQNLCTYFGEKKKEEREMDSWLEDSILCAIEKFFFVDLDPVIQGKIIFKTQINLTSRLPATHANFYFDICQNPFRSLPWSFLWLNIFFFFKLRMLQPPPSYFMHGLSVHFWN